jgi:hypothetical protein
MFITFLVLTATALLIMLGGLALNLSLYKHGGLHREQQDESKSPATQLHEVLFLHH